MKDNIYKIPVGKDEEPKGEALISITQERYNELIKKETVLDMFMILSKNKKDKEKEEEEEEEK